MKTPTVRDELQAKGLMLISYYSDLCYFARFYQAKRGLLTAKDYVSLNTSYSFSKFLGEFRVARNTFASSVMTEKLLQESFRWCSDKVKSEDVEGFKINIRKKQLVHDKVMTSLSSKILFLNNPKKVVPYDQLAKIAVGYKGKNYTEFFECVTEYKTVNSTILYRLNKQLDSDLTRIEKLFMSENPKVFRITSQLRENRILDKLLWSVGRNFR